MNANSIEPPIDALDEWPEPHWLFPSVVLATLETPDAVEVLSVDPTLPDWYDDDEENECEDTVLMARSGSGPELIQRYRIRGTFQVPTADRCLVIGQALMTANREGWGTSMCFDPHTLFGRHATGRPQSF